jgi:hypothetical protein
VIDYKLFTPLQPLQPGTLVVLEQIPGYVEWADVTNVLQFGYWPSFNIPYFPYIYNISGFALAAVVCSLSLCLSVSVSASLSLSFSLSLSLCLSLCLSLSLLGNRVP